MQNKLYTIQFFSPPDDQFAVSLWAAIAEPGNHEFCEMTKKVQTPGQEKIQTHGNKTSRERFLPLASPHS